MNYKKEDTVIVWVHSDCLNKKGPALAAYPNAPALWVWDDDLLRDWLLTIYRSRFIYECLLNLPVTIRRGNLVNELVQFARENGTTRIATTSTGNPNFLSICHELQARGLQVEIFDDRTMPVAESPPSFDLSLFSQLWQQAKQPVLGK